MRLLLREKEEGLMKRRLQGFNSFLSDVKLLDLNPLGRNFTWYHSNGRVMSRIDRALCIGRVE